MLLPVFLLTLSSYMAVAAPSDLGLLANYYHDCPASQGPHAVHLQRVIRRALRGDKAAMRSVILHKGIFSTGDNEGYSEAPVALLRTLGDVRYAAFVTSQSTEVRAAALGLLSCAHPKLRAHLPENCEVVSRVGRKSASHV